MREKTKPFLIILGVLVMCLCVGYLVFAWTPPTVAPPGGNVPAPLNVSTTTQAKAGVLRFTRFEDADLIDWFVDPGVAEPGVSAAFRGRVGIGTTAPGARLDVVGDIRDDGVIIATHGSFTVGGVSTSFFPVRFRNDAPGESVSSDLMIYRSNVHANGTWFGTFMFKISFHPWQHGHFPGQIEKLEYLTGGRDAPHNDPVGDVRDGSISGSGRDMIIFLRGGATYEWRNLQPTGPWTLLDGNSGGGNVTDSSGIVHTPITSQSTLIMNAKNRFFTNSLSLGTAGSGFFGGNVGIGTVAPGARLQVQGVGTTTAATVNVTDSTGTSRLFVRDDGNVGIATTTPAARLHIEVAAGTDAIRTNTFRLRPVSATELAIIDSGGNTAVIFDEGT